MPNLQNIKRNTNDFSFTDTVASLVNNRDYKAGYVDLINGKINDKTYFWTTLSAVGEEVGEVIYENVLNYVNNVANINTCKLRPLTSIAKVLGVTEFAILKNLHTIPEDVLKLMDIFSINRAYLLNINNFNSDFVKDLLSSTLDEDELIEAQKEFADFASRGELTASADGLSSFSIFGSISNEKYEQFVEESFFKLLASKLFQTYGNVSTDFIYSNLSVEGNFSTTNELAYTRNANENSFWSQDAIYNQYTAFSPGEDRLKSTASDYPSLLYRYKKTLNVSPSFNESKIVDDIEAGLDFLDRYQGGELSVLQLEIAERAKTRFSKEDGYAATRLDTRYSYYNEVEVKDYVKFIDDMYVLKQSEAAEGMSLEEISSAYLDWTPYRLTNKIIPYFLNNNYSDITISSNTSLLSNIHNQYEIYCNEVNESADFVDFIYDYYGNAFSEEVQEDEKKKILSKGNIVCIVARILKDICLAIVDIREKLKTQSQRNYMTGTKLLIEYILDEYLANVLINSYGTDPEKTKEFDKFGAQIVEYIDTTEYYNIGLLSDEAGYAKASVNLPYYSDLSNGGFTGSVTGIGLVANEIRDFYLSSLNIESKYISSDEDYYDFMSAVYEVGITKTFVGENGAIVLDKEFLDERLSINLDIDKISAEHNLTDEDYDFLTKNWYKTSDEGYRTINFEVLSDYADSISSSIDTISVNLEKYNDALSTRLAQQTELVLKYHGTDVAYYPWYNYKNQDFPTFQAHPYLYNFVEHDENEYPIENAFYGNANEDLIYELQSQNISVYLGEYGNITRVWRNGNFDYSGYKSRYENSLHNYGSSNSNGLYSVTHYDGIFYPPAIELYKKYAYNQLKDEKLGLSGFDLLSVHMIECVNNGYYDGQYNLDIKDISSMWHYYSHLGLTTAERKHIVDQMMKLSADILEMSDAEYRKNSQLHENDSLAAEPYDIYRYALDYNKNSLILLKRYNESANDVSQTEKRNTPGQLWIKLNSHPIGFPAFLNGDLSSYAQVLLDTGKYSFNYNYIALNNVFKEAATSEYGSRQSVNNIYDFDVNGNGQRLLYAVVNPSDNIEVPTFKNSVAITSKIVQRKTVNYSDPDAEIRIYALTKNGPDFIYPTNDALNANFNLRGLTSLSKSDYEFDGFFQSNNNVYLGYFKREIDSGDLIAVSINAAKYPSKEIASSNIESQSFAFPYSYRIKTLSTDFARTDKDAEIKLGYTSKNNTAGGCFTLVVSNKILSDKELYIQDYIGNNIARISAMEDLSSGYGFTEYIEATSGNWEDIVIDNSIQYGTAAKCQLMPIQRSIDSRISDLNRNAGVFVDGKLIFDYTQGQHFFKVTNYINNWYTLISNHYAWYHAKSYNDDIFEITADQYGYNNPPKDELIRTTYDGISVVIDGEPVIIPVQQIYGHCENNHLEVSFKENPIHVKAYDLASKKPTSFICSAEFSANMALESWQMYDSYFDFNLNEPGFRAFAAPADSWITANMQVISGWNTGTHLDYYLNGYTKNYFEFKVAPYVDATEDRQTVIAIHYKAPGFDEDNNVFVYGDFVDNEHLLTVIQHADPNWTPDDSGGSGGGSGGGGSGGGGGDGPGPGPNPGPDPSSPLNGNNYDSFDRFSDLFSIYDITETIMSNREPNPPPMVYALNSDASYIPLYYGVNGQNLHYRLKDSADDLISYNKEWHKQDNLSTDYVSRQSMELLGYSYQDFDSLIEDKENTIYKDEDTGKWTSIDSANLLNNSLRIYEDYLSGNVVFEKYNDGQFVSVDNNEPIVMSFTIDLSSLTPETSSYFNVLMLNASNGKDRNPIIAGPFSYETISSLYYDGEPTDEELYMISCYGYKPDNKVHIVGTPNPFNAKDTVFGLDYTNHIFNISAMSADLRYDDENEHFVIDLAMTKRVAINFVIQSSTILLYVYKSTLDQFEKFHYMEPFSLFPYNAAISSWNMPWKDKSHADLFINGWYLSDGWQPIDENGNSTANWNNISAYHDKRETFSANDNGYKSELCACGVQISAVVGHLPISAYHLSTDELSISLDDPRLTNLSLMENINLSSLTSFNDSYYLSTGQITWKISEEEKFNYLKLAYPPTLIDMLLYDKFYGTNKEHISYNIFELSNTYIFQLEDPLSMAIRIGTIAVPIGTAADEFVMAYEDYQSDQISVDIGGTNFVKYVEMLYDTSADTSISDAKNISIIDVDEERAKEIAANDVTAINNSEITAKTDAEQVYEVASISGYCREESERNSRSGTIDYYLLSATPEEISDYLKIYVNWRRYDVPGHEDEIELFFNYPNLFMSPYSYKTKNGYFAVEYKKNTYMRLKSGQDDYLYIILQFKYYDNAGVLCGIRDLPILTYHIYNVSDDKPKFIVTKTFEIDNRDGKYTYPGDGDDNLVYIIVGNQYYGFDDYVDTSDVNNPKKKVDDCIDYDFTLNCDLYLRTPVEVLSPIPLKYLNFEMLYERGRMSWAAKSEDDPEFVFEPTLSRPGKYADYKGNISANFDGNTYVSMLEFTMLMGASINEETLDRVFPIEIMNAEAEDINGNHPKFVFINGLIEIDDNGTDIRTGAYLARELNYDDTLSSELSTVISNKKNNAGWILEERRKALIRMYSIGTNEKTKLLATIPEDDAIPLKTTGTRETRFDRTNDLFIFADNGSES